MNVFSTNTGFLESNKHIRQSDGNTCTQSSLKIQDQGLNMFPCLYLFLNDILLAIFPKCSTVVTISQTTIEQIFTMTCNWIIPKIKLQDCVGIMTKRNEFK